MLRNWQLFAAAAWGLLAVLILGRSLFFEAQALDRLPVRNWTVANLIAAFLCVWNLARWYQAMSARDQRSSAMEPLQRSPSASSGYEYNPEFDFQKPDENRG